MENSAFVTASVLDFRTISNCSSHYETLMCNRICDSRKYFQIQEPGQGQISSMPKAMLTVVRYKIDHHCMGIYEGDRGNERK